MNDYSFYVVSMKYITKSEILHAAERTPHYLLRSNANYAVSIVTLRSGFKGIFIKSPRGDLRFWTFLTNCGPFEKLFVDLSVRRWVQRSRYLN